MNSYSVTLPRYILFGCGAVNALAAELPENCKNILLVTGTHAEKEGIAARIEKLLRQGGAENVYPVSGISPEPPLADIDRLVKMGRDLKVDSVIAVGGGSVIDAAKAAAALIPLDGTCADYFSGKKSIPGRTLFFAALPTTAGTGAEMTNNAVLTDPESKIKQSLRSSCMVADLALVDPELTYSCPPSLTAASGLDAFVQAVESYTNPKGSAVSKGLALTAAEKIFFHLREACEPHAKAEHRYAMAEGSMLTGMSFAQCGLGAVHGLAHPIGSLLKVPHGVSCAVLMPYVFEFNLPVCKQQYGELAEKLQMLSPLDRCSQDRCAEVFVEQVKKLASDLNIPETFAGYGLNESHFDFIIKNCRSGSMKSNPREMSDADVLAILKKLAG